MNIRKQNRIPEWDYRSVGTYFITICTDKRKKLLSDITLYDPLKKPDEPPHRQTSFEGELFCLILTPLGKTVEETILKISDIYPNVLLEHYVIMPNHVHLLIHLEETEEENMPPISRIINQMKGAVSKKAGFSVWQKGFYDHVIRGEKDYWIKYRYIDYNPLKWILKEDEYWI